MLKKRCARCGLMKTIDLFGKDCTTPTGLRVYCRKCACDKTREGYKRGRRNRIESSQRWYRRNADRIKIMRRDRMYRLRQEVIDGYGGKCTCCGETEREFLTVEHLNGDGCKERKVMHYDQMLQQIINEEFPSRYTILCMNCNFAKRRGPCPHEKARAALRLAGEQQ